MFTGIIEKTARVIGVADGPKFRRLTIAADWPDVGLGQSVAVNGACLTVADVAPGELGFDVILETLDKTNLGLLGAGDGVHVERALRIGDRLDGHFVQGHVDGVARLIAAKSNHDEWRLRLQAPPDLAKYLTPKGSVTLDGVSLTIAAVSGGEFEVALIPTTIQLTSLGKRPVGWPFNLECDPLAKTVISWLERRE
ncbi:MAG TPA: riboflavin synthase [Tepidisphaeraceae bacterium]|jgi:riboflavin synthase|nr:riboflavin synthase [Tepidisphaeraceae bacterium]